jgi:hypothetical protein
MYKNELSPKSIARAIRFSADKKFIVGMPDGFSDSDKALLSTSELYFDRFGTGVLDIINSALVVIESEESKSSEEKHLTECISLFDLTYNPMFEDNTTDAHSYTRDKAVFTQMCAMIYRYCFGVLQGLKTLEMKNLMACLIYFNQKNHVTSILVEQRSG